jgi:GWxTD domain-containing protein
MSEITELTWLNRRIRIQSTDEEREQFIEQFWLRRDPTPDTEENEFKEEHYRRIAYANDHYASGIPGWKTDRGRIYIIYGPPDEIESHPSGGTYERPMEEGGGETSTYPFEQWRYRYMEGIGTNIIIEFVDPTMSGEYHMTMDPSEKDALTYVPGVEDSVSKDFPDSLFQQSVKQSSIYQKALPLRPGLYRLDLVIKDVESGNVGVVNTRLAVPRYEDVKLDASTLILADQIEHVPAKQIGTGQFVLGSSKVRPRMDGDFTTNDKLGIYLQVYNLKPDDKTHKSNATFVYTVKKGDQQIMQFKETSEQMKQTGEQVTIERLLPLATLAPGKYTLEVSATDTLSQSSISRTADFSIKNPVEPKTAANATPGR